MTLSKWTPFRSVIITVTILSGLETVFAEEIRFPEPDPPALFLPIAQKALQPQATISATSPTTEWVLHKSADNTHPDGEEQQMLWLMNRARSNPTQEGIWLAELDDPDVAFARSYFGVDLDLLRSEFASYSVKPPAAFDRRLYNAAYAHSLDLIARDAQDHTGQFDRITAAGFSLSSARGNVFSYTKHALHGHAGFNIDWGGSDGSGMQTGRGHRMAIMSVDGNYTNVGIAAVPDNDPDNSVGPYVVTGNYCYANTSSSDHYNRFIVGTVWEDQNGNELYDPGEGMGSVNVVPDNGTYFAVTSDAGGFAIPITAAGTYQVVFSGGTLPGNVQRTIDVGDVSVLLDLEIKIVPGDINGDLTVNLADAVLALQVSAGGTPASAVFKDADVDGDGKIGIAEGIYALETTSDSP